MKAVTNAERIRGMTDDELAVFLCEIDVSTDGPWLELWDKEVCVKSCARDSCDGCCTQQNIARWWLRQPAREDGNVFLS